MWPNKKQQAAARNVMQDDHYVGRRSAFVIGTKIYGWKFQHPKFGWCGGHWDDVWASHRSVIEMRMSHCEWPTELIEELA